METIDNIVPYDREYIEDVNNFLLVRNSAFWHGYFDFFSSDAGKRFSQTINEKKSRLDSDDISYRVINYWEKSGILDSERPEGKGWRKFSIMDHIWLKIVFELRNFGFPIEKIAKVREKLQKRKMLGAKIGFEYAQYPLLEYYVACSFAGRIPCYLVVFHDGTVEPLTLVQFNLGTTLHLFSHCLRISLNDVLQDVYPKLDLKPQFQYNLDLEPSEFELLSMIRMRSFESIRVKMNDGKIEMIEATQTENIEKRIVDILKEENYQNIEIKQDNGNIVYISRTIKKKFD